MTKTIKIEHLTDVYDCDTCGPTWAYGFAVTFPDGSDLMLEPQAYCSGSQSFDDEKLMIAILERLGYNVEYGE